MDDDEDRDPPTEAPAGWTIGVDLPPEPDDRSAVLDRDEDIWQRRGAFWVRVGIPPVGMFARLPEDHAKTWAHLVVDRGPLAPLVIKPEDGDNGYRLYGAAYTEVVRTLMATLSSAVIDELCDGPVTVESAASVIARHCAPESIGAPTGVGLKPTDPDGPWVPGVVIGRPVRDSPQA